MATKKTTYAGVTTEISDTLFVKPKKYKNPPKKSIKFGSLSLYFDGVYYLTSKIKETGRLKDKPFEIQGVFYRGKWRQDTFFITKDFKNFLLENL